MIMSTCARRSSKLPPLVLCLAFLSTLVIPLPGVAQDPKPVDREAAQKPVRPQASPQASPSPSTQEATRKPKVEKKLEETPSPRDPMSTPTFNGLRLRSIGPAFTSGRVSGFAVDPTNPSRYFVAVASGGVWKTINAGTT